MPQNHKYVLGAMFYEFRFFECQQIWMSKNDDLKK